MNYFDVFLISISNILLILNKGEKPHFRTIISAFGDPSFGNKPPSNINMLYFYFSQSTSSKDRFFNRVGTQARLLEYGNCERIFALLYFVPHSVDIIYISQKYIPGKYFLCGGCFVNNRIML